MGGSTVEHTHTVEIIVKSKIEDVKGIGKGNTVNYQIDDIIVNGNVDVTKLIKINKMLFRIIYLV